MKSTPDGDGTLLDHSLIFYGGGMGDSNAHATDPLPLVAVGGLVGTGHRHLLQSPKTPVANLWLGVAEKFGLNLERLGNSDGAHFALVLSRKGLSRTGAGTLALW